MEERDISHNDNTNSVIDVWEKVFTDEIVSLLVEMSNKYASQHNHNLGVTHNEMRVYIGILLLTGYLCPKNIRMFWEIKSDVHNELVSSSMRRKRFLEIHQYLHTCDNFQLSKNDKFAKLSEYFRLLNKSFLQNFDNIFTLDISVDETMVPYYGKYGCKQHIHGKPIRFAYKLWSACTPLGYLIQFIPYQGSKGCQLSHQKTYGLGASVVLELLSFLPKNQKYRLYFDNFFTGLPLLDKLTELGHFGTGTIRDNRIEKCPLESQKDMKKKERGALCMRTTTDMAIVRWNDNNIVTLASNAYGVQPLSTINRITSINTKNKNQCMSPKDCINV